MGNSSGEPTPPDDLSEALVQRIDVLRTPIEEEIRANAAGEILDIKNYGAYAIVRKHPPNPDSDDANTEIPILYHVRRELQSDGTESLYWAHLGDVHNSAQIRCEFCGRTLDENVDICPHCGSDDIDHSDTEE